MTDSKEAALTHDLGCHQKIVSAQLVNDSCLGLPGHQQMTPDFDAMEPCQSTMSLT